MKINNIPWLVLTLTVACLFLFGSPLGGSERSLGAGAVPVFLPGVDFSGDGADDLCIFTPRDGVWRIRGLTVVWFGREGDCPAAGDYDGDGIAEIAVFRPQGGLWAVRRATRFYFGLPEDLPAARDYTGDGVWDPAVFRPRTGLWVIRGIGLTWFGREGDLPVPADYAGDGSAEMGIFRPSTGLWAIKGQTRLYFGRPGDLPVPGDYIGEGTTGAGIYRESSGLWAIRHFTRVYFGGPGYIPAPLYYTGSPGLRIAVYDPARGLWAVRGVTRIYSGWAGGVPVPGYYPGPEPAEEPGEPAAKSGETPTPTAPPAPTATPSPSATASPTPIPSPSVPLIDEGFDYFHQGRRPEDWSFVNCDSDNDTYLTSGNYGRQPPSLKLDATDDAIITSEFFQPEELAFWIKGQGTDISSALLVDEYHGADWHRLTDIFNLPTSGTDFPPLLLNPSTSQVKFTYRKSVGNLAFDDVRISEPATPSPLATATPYPAATVPPSPPPTAPPSATPTPTPPVEPLAVVINEIGWMGTQAASADEYIELYNTTGNAISLNGWTLQAADGTPDISLSGTIPAEGYFLLERTDDNTISDVTADQVYTGGLENTGELLRLTDGTAQLIDSAGSEAREWFAGETAGGYYSMERIDPAISGITESNWRSNDGCRVNGSDANGNPINASPSGLNSAYYPGPPLDFDLDAFDGRVACEWSAAEPGRFDIDGYNVYRREDGGFYQGPLNQDPIEGLSYSDETVTNGVKYYYVCRTVDDEGNVSSCSSDEETVTPGSPVVLGDNVIISEVLFDPYGLESLYEWIELYNPTASGITLDLWWITDGEGRYTFPEDGDLVIAAGEYLVLGASSLAAAGEVDVVYNGQTTSEGDILLSNTGDEVILYNSQSEIVDELRYEGNWTRAESYSLVRKAIQRSSNYIELKNIGLYSVNLEGLKIFDGAETDELKAFRTDETVLMPGQYALIVNNQFYNNYDIEEGTVGVTCGDLAIGNGLTPLDDLILYSWNGTSELDTFTSFSAVESPPDGTSVEKINPLLGDFPSNWGLCTDLSGSTPGRTNSLTE